MTTTKKIMSAIKTLIIAALLILAMGYALVGSVLQESYKLTPLTNWEVMEGEVTKCS